MSRIAVVHGVYPTIDDQSARRTAKVVIRFKFASWGSLPSGLSENLDCVLDMFENDRADAARAWVIDSLADGAVLGRAARRSKRFVRCLRILEPKIQQDQLLCVGPLHFAQRCLFNELTQFRSFRSFILTSEYLGNESRSRNF